MNGATTSLARSAGRSPSPGTKTVGRRAVLIAATCLFLAGPRVLAHNVVDSPNLGKLITSADLIVRGPVTSETRLEKGALVATLKVDKVLKGHGPGSEITFQSDPDHGVRYQRGERAVVFLTRLPPGSEPRYISPQIFHAKYTITSFDPTGYDALITGVLELSKVEDASQRRQRTKELMTQQLHSHERDVRMYAKRVLGLRTED